MQHSNLLHSPTFISKINYHTTWASPCLNWLQMCLFVEELIRGAMRNTSKPHITGLLWGQSTIGHWISSTKASNVGSFPMSQCQPSSWLTIEVPYLAHHPSGPRFNIKMSSYQYGKSRCRDKTVVRSSYLHNGISYTGKMSFLYWIGALVLKH